MNHTETALRQLNAIGALSAADVLGDPDFQGIQQTAFFAELVGKKIGHPLGTSL